MTIRGHILNKAKELTEGNRVDTYGDVNDSMEVFANLLSAQFGHTYNKTDAAIIMVLAKLSRIGFSYEHQDNYIDGAAYMAIAGEVSGAFDATT